MDLKLLPFFHFYIGLHKLFLKKDKVDKTSNLFVGDDIYSSNDQIQEISNILVEHRNVCELVLTNGNSITMDENNYVYLFNKGWTRLKEVTKKDKVLNKVNLINENSLYEKGIVGFSNNIKGKRMPVSIPEQVNERFAEWVGFISANGEIAPTHEISVFLKDQYDIDYYTKLTKEAINITPLKRQDPRENRSAEIYFLSINIANFVRSFLGPKMGLRKVPTFIIDASIKEQLAYIKGMCFWSIRERNSVVAYMGVSKPMAEFCALVLRASGYQISVLPKKRLSKQTTYYVRLIGVYKKRYKFEFVKESCNFVFGKYATDKIFFKDEFVQYKTLANKRYKINEFSLDYVWIDVKDVKNLGSKECISIKTLHKNGICFNQIVVAGTM